jgi:hypothetical protein
MQEVFGRDEPLPAGNEGFLGAESSPAGETVSLSQYLANKAVRGGRQPIRLEQQKPRSPPSVRHLGDLHHIKWFCTN